MREEGDAALLLQGPPHRDPRAQQMPAPGVLQRAWNKYGENNFDFKVLLKCNKKDKIDYENRCMVLQSYNVLKTANVDLIFTPAFRAKLSAAHLGRKWPRSAVDKTARSAVSMEATC